MNYYSNFSDPVPFEKTSSRFYVDNRKFGFLAGNHWIRALLVVSVIMGSGFTGCNHNINNKYNTNNFEPTKFEVQSSGIIPAAERTAVYYPKIKNKKIGLVVNHTSRVGGSHLLDTLLSLGANVTAIFTPEHGLQGTADAGEKINSSAYGPDAIPIYSLYGSSRKPSAEQLEDLELVIFDIQDVGVRYYTYVGTMHYVMEACAENKVPFMILDRPNPNGFYVDGPVLDMNYTSFVGMHPVPVVHGLTVGEYARMINGEGWLPGGIQCELEVIQCLNYDHTMTYDLPVKPSPNLPNLTSILLYPSLCLFEGTTLSIGRGTEKQFQVIGHPGLGPGDFAFTPINRPGATQPKHQNIECFGEDLSGIPHTDFLRTGSVNFEYLLKYYELINRKGLEFFLESNSFVRLSGTPVLKEQIMSGKSMAEIRESWQEDLEAYKQMRKKYLIYP